MNREVVLGYAVLMAGMLAIAMILFGLTALAADQPVDRTMGPVMESGKALSA